MRPCPLFGKAIYLDCLDCERKFCKTMCYSRLQKEYVKKSKEIQKRSKIFQILRGIKYSEFAGALNVGMAVDGFDCPYAYNCRVFGYEIVSYSRQKAIEVYKEKWKSEGNSVGGLNLHHYFFVSDNAPNIFKDECVERIEQEKLANLANRNWADSKNFVKNKMNALAMKEMKKKFINLMLYHKQIAYDENKRKYVGYDYYEMWCKK